MLNFDYNERPGLLEEELRNHYDKRNYSVVRFFDDPNKAEQLLFAGCTLSQAKTYCLSPKSCREGQWYDGFRREAD